MLFMLSVFANFMRENKVNKLEIVVENYDT